ncbi:hypothetical protein BKA62DRAFT_340617 [Auriculariales sp. MPI-PUGE-AT-0066]|nr:hypothetical protein BKA62DRAFT_340617 [Auriculariales sp. MPI-PUGE-AT-0066]
MATIPPSQRAWRFVRKGKPAVALDFDQNLPVPSELAEGDVLVRVAAAALNPVGTVVMGKFPLWLSKPPMVAENDLSGTIVASKDSARPVGSRVIGFIPVPLQLKTKQGALQEYARLPGSNTVLLPENLKFEEGAFALAAETALQELMVNHKLEEGQTVFINGVTSAVGAFAAQICKVKGCTVWGSASGKNEGLARSLGVDVFMDYQKRPVHLQLMDLKLERKFDLVLDAVGFMNSPLYPNCESYLTETGTFVTSMHGPSNFGLGGFGELLALLWTLRPSYLGGVRRKFSMAQVNHKIADLQQLADWLAEGKIRPYVDSVHAFEDALQAFERIASFRAHGKVVVRVSSDE